jgi:hypothetical protein
MRTAVPGREQLVAVPDEEHGRTIQLDPDGSPIREIGRSEQRGGPAIIAHDRRIFASLR